MDLDADGAPDVLATNREANAVSIYRQSPEEGLSAPTLAPAYAELSGLTAGDVNGDGTLDIVVGNKKGAFVHLHTVKKVSQKEWQAAQPKKLK